MLSISIRYGGKLSYAMRALGPMLGSNSSQTETALSQMLGHDGASRHTLLSKMLRHNSARTQNHSNTSIGLHQRSCAAVCDMFLGKNHGSHFITIKSIGKTHHPVPLRFAVNGSASARYASLPSTLATTRRRDNSARQSPSSRGGRAARQRPAAPGAATASAPAPAPAHAPPAPPPFASTATSGARSSAAPHRPEPHGTEAVDRRGQNTALTTFHSPAQTKGPGRSIFEEHFRTDEEVNSWQNITLMHS